MGRKRSRKPPGRDLTPSHPAPAQPAADRLLGDIRSLIEQARRHVAQNVNSAMVGLYWNIGKRIRTLRQKIDRLFFERTAVSKKPKELIRAELDALRGEDRLTPDLVFRDPYFLDFLGLAGTYNEKDIEQAILRELEAFILELGTDFAFLARQKRITVDDEEYYLDLLFYHRRLRRLRGWPICRRRLV